MKIFAIGFFLISLKTPAASLVCPLKNKSNELLKVALTPEISSNFGKCKFKKSNKIECRAEGYEFDIKLSKGITKKNRIHYPLILKENRRPPKRFFCQIVTEKES